MANELSPRELEIDEAFTKAMSAALAEWKGGDGSRGSQA